MDHTSCDLNRVEKIFPVGSAVAGISYRSTGAALACASNSGILASEIPPRRASRRIRRIVEGCVSIFSSSRPQ
jgi:hypothetical protein